MCMFGYLKIVPNKPSSCLIVLGKGGGGKKQGKVIIALTEILSYYPKLKQVNH